MEKHSCGNSYVKVVDRTHLMFNIYDKHIKLLNTYCF